MPEIIVAPNRKPKKRGAPVGNLNGAKSGWEVFWKRRVLRGKDGWISGLLKDYTSELIADRGGIDDASAAERRTIEVAMAARGCSMLILREASERGLIVATENGIDLAPAAKELGRFMTLELNALRAIGMGKRARPAQSLDDVVAEILAENATNSAQDGQGTTSSGGQG
jgi:hypothetical protein